LTSHGYVRRGYLGVVTQQVMPTGAQRDALQRDAALLIVSVEANSPAEAGGLLIGDLIASVDGHAVNDADALLSVLTGDRVGKALPIVVLRGGAHTMLSVTLGQKS
jgi:S1-C subfamily serine protease